jgi:hypothetical protein
LPLDRVYNNHVFIDHNDSRLGNDTIDVSWDDDPGYSYQAPDTPEFFYSGGSAAKPMHYWTTGQKTTQSLPDFDNPCMRVWGKYFSSQPTVHTWFTGNHSLQYAQFMTDCNSTVASWRSGLRQIR